MLGVWEVPAHVAVAGLQVVADVVTSLQFAVATAAAAAAAARMC